MVKLQWSFWAAIVSRLIVLGTSLVNASQNSEVLAARRYFYVGGQYVDVMRTRLIASR